jgi:hypothetical protein
MAQRADLCAIRTPLQGNRVPDGTRWAADNGCFGDGFPGYGKWIGWLEGHAEHADRALFATAPDVFRPDLGRGDAKATLKRSLPWLPAIRALGYPTAFVAQEGSENPGLIPWELVDVVFIGGGDEWKLGRGSQLVVDEALRRGRRVHMGRVNSLERLVASTPLMAPTRCSRRTRTSGTCAGGWTSSTASWTCSRWAYLTRAVDRDRPRRHVLQRHHLVRRVDDRDQPPRP